MEMTIPVAGGAVSKEQLLADAWLDRDLSWLEFNRRVLHEALDPRTPLLERVKFLAIFTSNLDEFFMKRVGLLRGKARAESEDDPVASMRATRATRLAKIRAAVVQMLARRRRAATPKCCARAGAARHRARPWERADRRAEGESSSAISMPTFRRR